MEDANNINLDINNIKFNETPIKLGHKDNDEFKKEYEAVKKYVEKNRINNIKIRKKEQLIEGVELKNSWIIGPEGQLFVIPSKVDNSRTFKKDDLILPNENVLISGVNRLQSFDQKKKGQSRVKVIINPEDFAAFIYKSTPNNLGNFGFYSNECNILQKSPLFVCAGFASNTGASHFKDRPMYWLMGQTPQQSYIIQKNAGKELTQEIPKLSKESKIDYAIQLLLEVYELHNEKMIAHKDIKPKNIAIKGNSLNLFDFGLSVSSDKAINEKEFVCVGTQGYLPMRDDYATFRAISYEFDRRGAILKGEETNWEAYKKFDLYAVKFTLKELLVDVKLPSEILERINFKVVRDKDFISSLKFADDPPKFLAALLILNQNGINLGRNEIKAIQGNIELQSFICKQFKRKGADQKDTDKKLERHGILLIKISALRHALESEKGWLSRNRLKNAKINELMKLEKTTNIDELRTLAQLSINDTRVTKGFMQGFFCSSFGKGSLNSKRNFSSNRTETLLSEILTSKLTS